MELAVEMKSKIENKMFYQFTHVLNSKKAELRFGFELVIPVLLELGLGLGLGSGLGYPNPRFRVGDGHSSDGQDDVLRSSLG